ncbi:unnamed protein product [Plutella xylostella]|uniref:(diamondback moth) hypothetical protein n=1 Tax=Plutella xylostella TaxID=51655 RepID=A0A8S4FLW1_PLUXY|nr:unnamed protein product [Plutella xylostella]
MTMQETMSDQDPTNLDLSKVAALQQKRTLAFVNHFVLSTIQFLNNFMKQCEQQLMQFERKLEKAEAALVILETRLASIPEVANTQTPKTADNSEKDSSKPHDSEHPEPPPASTPVEEPPAEAETPAPGPSHPEYDRFVKMVQVGVPLEAVKLKVSIEGLDPSIFEKIVKK